MRLQRAECAARARARQEPPQCLDCGETRECLAVYSNEMPRPPSPDRGHGEKLLDDGIVEDGGGEEQNDCQNNPRIAAAFCVLFIVAFIWGIHTAVTEPTPP